MTARYPRLVYMYPQKHELFHFCPLHWFYHCVICVCISSSGFKARKGGIVSRQLVAHVQLLKLLTGVLNCYGNLPLTTGQQLRLKKQSCRQQALGEQLLSSSPR